MLYKRNIIKISGKDSKDFLQGLITNDINQNETFYSLILSSTGRYIFDFFITQKDNSYYIEIEEDDSDIFIKKLTMLRLRKEVDIEDLSNIFLFTYTKNPITNSFITYRDPRYLKLGYRNILYKEDKSDCGIDDLYMEDKFKYSIPDGTYDLIKEKSFPQEFGLDRLYAINFKKGCYVGQESISRIRTQGVIRKKIFKIVSEINLDNFINLNILYEGEKVGVVTSFKKNVGIS